MLTLTGFSNEIRLKYHIMKKISNYLRRKWFKHAMVQRTVRLITLIRLIYMRLRGVNGAGICKPTKKILFLRITKKDFHLKNNKRIKQFLNNTLITNLFSYQIIVIFDN